MSKRVGIRLGSNSLKALLREAQKARARAERANRAKEKALATLSHDIRTPLMSMLLYAQILQRGEMTNAEVVHAGEVIERSARIQLRFLDATRIAVTKSRGVCLSDHVVENVEA